MYHASDILSKVEALASQVHLLKDRMAKQKVSVRLEHYWELAYVRSRFAEFKLRVGQFGEDDDVQLTRDQAAIEASWSDLMHAINALLAALSETNKGGTWTVPHQQLCTVYGGQRAKRKQTQNDHR